MTSAYRRATTIARRAAFGLGLLAVALIAVAVLATSRSGAHQGAATADDVAPAASHPQVVEPEAGVVAPADAAPASPTTSTTASTDASRRADDAEVRRELRQLKELAAKADLAVGVVGRVLADGTAIAPADAPQAVQDVIRSGNVIATTPYLWGGGHGAWASKGYDCSGSVSFALAGAGLLNAPLTSGLLAGWGAPGPGRWITIYANGGHVFMEVAGLRFDTGALSGSGTRWQPTRRDTTGFVARHPPGY
ncbi:MAG: peptidoglycan DL-endopeptidase RipB [Solirubrobacteraceae bacterium]|jgi:cell wall-associated NlpC family hydrolase|nr:peptidoglycan DL-endopeptidase RipB [Solirubrobacteraceae bacterium]